MHDTNRTFFTAACIFGFASLAAVVLASPVQAQTDTLTPIVSTGPGVDHDRVRAGFENRLQRSRSSREQLYWRLPAATTRGTSPLDFLTSAGNWLLTQQQPSGA